MHLERQLIGIVGGEIVAHVVIAGAAIPLQIAREWARGFLPRRTAESRRSRPYQCSGSRCSLPGLAGRGQALFGGGLKTVVMAVRAGIELSDRSESAGRSVRHRERRKAALANGLISVHLRRVGLVHRARADILRAQIDRAADLVFQRKAPLHEVRRVQFAIRHGGDRHRLQAGRRDSTSGDAQESWPAAKPVLKIWLAATVASMALPGTPGAMDVPPTVPSRPP